MQCKWHVTHGAYTHLDLTSPDYINASSKSFLQRALDAYRLDAQAARHSTICLVTNHLPARDDLLHAIVRTKSFGLDVDKLFEGRTSKSATGRVRQVWSEHLNLSGDELREFCKRLRLHKSFDSLDQLRERLDEVFKYYGLIPTGVGRSVTEYDDLVFQWAAQGRNRFDRKSFKAVCKAEGILGSPKPRVQVFGVKSFEHAIDRLEDRCTSTLNLVGEFDGRAIRNPGDWGVKLVPDLKAFLASSAQQAGSSLRLAMDAHVTLAFAAGAVLNTKSGRRVEIEQRSPDRMVWAADDAPVDPAWPGWDFEVEQLSAESADIAIAVGLSRPIVADVEAFIRTSVPNVGRLLVASPEGGAAQTSVKCGAHANMLAERLVGEVSTLRRQNPGVASQVHLFIAAPNAFTFFLGRHAPTLWPLTLYEYDFEKLHTGSYEPSLCLP